MPKNNDPGLRARGQLIKAAREQKEWTQVDLGNLMGRSSITISRWETGMHDITDPEDIKLITSLLGISKTRFRHAPADITDRMEHVEKQLQELPDQLAEKLSDQLADAVIDKLIGIYGNSDLAAKAFEQYLERLGREVGRGAPLSRLSRGRQRALRAAAA